MNYNLKDSLIKIEYEKDDVPKECGIYFIYDNDENNFPNRPVYIGKATGAEGLYQRIVKQHLNPEYTTGKSIHSSFRKSVAEKHPINSADEAKAVVDFIKENYTFYYLILDINKLKIKIGCNLKFNNKKLFSSKDNLKKSAVKGFITEIEEALIRSLNPELNKQGKNKPPLEPPLNI